MATYQQDSALIEYAGRFRDEDGKAWSHWQPQIRIRTTGASTVTLNIDILDANTVDLTFVTWFIDGGDWNLEWVTTAAETGSGARAVVITLPDAGVHDVSFSFGAKQTSQWAGTNYVKLDNLVLDAGSLLTPTTNTLPKVLCVGDSWMATQNNWPYLMCGNIAPYFAAFGGAKASDLDDRIDYIYGTTPETDPDFDAVIINSSVNDYVAAVPGATFEASLASIVDKILAQQTKAQVFLVQSPDNGVNTFGDYGANMSTIASTRSRVHYIPMDAGVEAGLTWADTYHLDYAGRQAMATFVLGEMGNTLPHLSTPSNYIGVEFGGEIQSIYKAYQGNTFSQDGATYYSESGGVVSSATAIDLTAYTT